jgi:hypothetical protein
MTNLTQVAEKILDGLGNLHRYRIANMAQIESILAELLKEAVEEALAKRDAEQFGEAFMLNGKCIAPNEIYKSTADYVKEAKQEAYRICAELAENHEGDANDPCDFVIRQIAEAIRAKAAEEKE